MFLDEDDLGALEDEPDGLAEDEDEDESEEDETAPGVGGPRPLLRPGRGHLVIRMVDNLKPADVGRVFLHGVTFICWTFHKSGFLG